MGNNPLIYQAKDGSLRLAVSLEDDTIWLTQKQMSELFKKDVRTINEHIQNIYVEEELLQKRTIRKFRIVRLEGNREITRNIEHYNLDVVISVGYRVKSNEGTRFRVWANRVLKDYLISGYVLDQKRLKNSQIQEIQKTLNLFKQA